MGIKVPIKSDLLESRIMSDPFWYHPYPASQQMVGVQKKVNN